MKPEEIMLGDYVQVNGEAFKVISISYFDIGISDSKKDFYQEHIDNIEPIPLTPEILEKNGFERVNGEYQDVFYIYDGIELLIDNVYTLFGQCKMPIKYVHELQHALRLCSINKEIEI